MDSVKTQRDQIREIHKLVDDAVEKLEQVLRGLRALDERLADETSGSGKPAAPGPAGSST
jgi:hypothetical protein